MATDISCVFGATFVTKTSERFSGPFLEHPSVYPTSLRTIGDAIVPRQCKDTFKRKARKNFLVNLKCERCILLRLAYVLDMHH